MNFEIPWANQRQSLLPLQDWGQIGSNHLTFAEEIFVSSISIAPPAAVWYVERMTPSCLAITDTCNIRIYSEILTIHVWYIVFSCQYTLWWVVRRNVSRNREIIISQHNVLLMYYYYHYYHRINLFYQFIAPKLFNLNTITCENMPGKIRCHI